MALTSLLIERSQRLEKQLRERIQVAREAGRLTPDVVAAHAALHVVDDYGVPITPEPHHMLWLRLLCDLRIKKLLIIAPPEAAKTTWLLSGFVSAYMGFWPENNVIITGSAGDVGRRRSLSLRAMAESAAWQQTYPGVLPANGLTWEQKEWSLAPNGVPRAGRLHPTVSAYGPGGSITGARADLLVADDILDFENTRTAHQRKTVTAWFYNSFLSRLKAGGVVRAIGTAWTHDDVYARLRRESDWVICHIPLLSPGEQVYAYLTYPDDWPHEYMGEPLGQPVAELLGRDEEST